VKLALVRQKYTPFGGAERFVERALAALRSQGTDVTIVARSWQGQPGPGFLRCNPFFVGRTWRDAGFARCVRHLIDEGRFDLVQSHERIAGCHIFRAGDGVHATWLDLRDQARGGSSRLATALSPWHRYTLAAEAAMFRHPNLRAVICNSRMVKADIARRFGVTDDKLHVIYNGVDLEHFQPCLRAAQRQPLRQALAIDDARPVILFVGSGFERKGVPALLRALAQMRRRDALLLVVGRDSGQRKMMALAERLGVAERVRFLGGQQDVRPYYGAADCFALPTVYDPMPNAALEALACGLPVVTSTTSGAAELIQPGVNGQVGAAGDIQGLADHLDSLLVPGSYDATEVRATVTGFGITAMAARLADLYGRVAGPAPL
jgi:UDP-glucose:(heptosyl)LPS alpha-1,3-glucosyltransferase